MTVHLLKKEGDEYFINDTKLIENIEGLKPLVDETAVSILKYLSGKPAYVDDISKNLHVSKTKVEAHLKSLEKAGLVSVVQVIEKKGKTLKAYRGSSSAVSFEISSASKRFNPAETSLKNENAARFYKKFIKDGVFDGYICVGSPDPHGEYKAIARDTHFAVYLGMFLGRLCELPKRLPIVLDTDVISKNLFKENLMVIGGPVTNLITRDVNNFLPLKFVKEEGWILKDKEGMYGREYEGVVEKIRNPFDRNKDVIVLGGIRNTGTLAAILAATQFYNGTFRNFNDEQSWGTIVRGYDIDGDGQIDSIETAR